MGGKGPEGRGTWEVRRSSQDLWLACSDNYENVV